MEEIFYKICPTRLCGTISGFSLPQSEIKKDEKYSCSLCQKEHKLSKWKKSNDKDYNKQVQIRGECNFYQK